jgi:hypothetical protein
MATILQRSELTAPGDESIDYPVGHIGDNAAGLARISLVGSWTGGVTLYNSLGDLRWTVIKSYSNGPEDDIAIICTKKEYFKFVAASNFVGSALVIVSQGEVIT